ncbi:hypothetical protein [Streptomyces sp. NPDC048623]|uniref:hypothetical protein n=1 Tax=Streptomyces sp. NPDC048623 TaxID=3155761 RepID=UPI00343E1EB7
MNKRVLEMRHTPDSGTERSGDEKKRFGLSVPQVAGSALAAVVAAKLASSLGVYGTILGAGVISVIATCGGPVLQHLFKRTGEQMREVTQQGRQSGTAPAKESQRPQAQGEFGEPTVHGTRMRGWKRPALGAAAVFLLAMGGITAYELTSGQDLGGTKGTTTFGSVVRGGDPAGDGGKGDDGPSPTPRQEGGAGTATPTPGDTPAGGGTGTATPEPTGTPTETPTPSGSTGPTGGTGTTPPATTPPATESASPPATDAG